MHSKLSTKSPKLSSNEFFELLKQNSINQSSLDHNSLKVENLPNLSEIDFVLSTQTKEFLLENSKYLNQLQSDLDQFNFTLIETKNYLNSVKTIFQENLSQNLYD